MSPLLVYGAIATFLVLCSRPTADEYLLAPVFSGYYVDQPTEMLFTPSENVLIRYFQGANAIVRLGWDGWPNAATFQMGSGVLTNLLGGFATVIQGAVFLLITAFLLRYLSKFLLASPAKVYPFVGVFGLVLIVGMSVGNFHTPRANFSLFPFMGIRFGLYLVHAVAFVVLISALERSGRFRSKPNSGELVAIILFCGFASLWYVAYLILYMAVRAIVGAVSRQATLRYVTVLAVIASSTFVFHAGLAGARGRTSAQDQGLLRTFSRFVQDVVLNLNSRLYGTEIWSVILGWHFWTSLFAGVIAGIGFADKTFRKDNLRRLAISLSSVTIALPMVFLFQEYLTYEAWWHRTTPIIISSITALTLGLCCGVGLSKKFESVKTLFCTVALISATAVLLPGLYRDIAAANKFRDQWDKGNILGIGSPVENNADYNVINAFRLHPYRHPRWDVQKRMMDTVPMEISYFNREGLSVSSDEVAGWSKVEVSFKNSPFDVEIGGLLSYELTTGFGVSAPLTVQVSDANGQRDIDVSEKDLIVVSGQVTIPGRLTLWVVDQTNQGPFGGPAQVAIGFRDSAATGKSLVMRS
jgi:hypothetical protein